ncbi:MAG: hypothetical protein V8T87_03145 [Victivallales bacterium]
MTPQGRVIAQSPLPQAFPENIMPDLSTRFYTVSGISFCVTTERLFDGNILEIGRADHTNGAWNFNSLIFFSTIGTILCLGTLCGWLIARKFIAGVERLNAAAQHIIQSGDFSKRVPVEHDGVEIDDQGVQQHERQYGKVITEHHRRYRARPADASDANARHGGSDGKRAAGTRTLPGDGM